jgi:hypothetical protein
MRPWEKLPEKLKESNRAQADDIPEKLKRIRCGFAPAAGKAKRFELTKAEVETLAEVEHERWMAERQRAGWTLGPRRNATKKVSPYLVPWSELPESAKKNDRDTVRGMPEFMAEAGFEIYRLE